MSVILKSYEYLIKNYNESSSINLHNHLNLFYLDIDSNFKNHKRLNYRNSVDMIANSQYGGITPKEMNDIYDSIYKQFKSKITLSNFTGNIPEEYKKNYKEYLELLLNYITEFNPENFLKIYTDNKEITDYISDTSIMDLHISTIVYKMNIKKDEKVIVIGDLHGSIHTFIRHLYRFFKLGIIDKDTLKIKNGYKIIFLGDVLDRGIFSFELLVYIFYLMEINNTNENTKILLNRGNHEEFNINSYNGFDEELDEKLALFDYPEKFSNLHEKINEKLGLLPSAIILEYENGERMYLSHGGFPIQNYIISDSNIANTQYVNSYQVLELNQLPTVWKIEFKDGKNYELIKHNSGFLNDKDAGLEYNTTRWMDYYLDESLKIAEKENVVHYVRKRGLIANQKLLNDFLDKNNIKFILRGHQDKYENSFIVGMNISPANRNFKVPEEYSSAILFKSEIQYHDDETQNDFVKDETYKIDVSKFNQIYQSFASKYPKPILTISTNTDSGRNLEADSYVVLEYIIPEAISSEKKGGYYEKYMKYKMKYINLKNNLNI